MNKTSVTLPLLLASIAAGSLVGQAPPDLAEAMRARDRAIDAGDTAAWERFTAPEFTAVDAAGHFLTRRGHLAALRRARLARTTSQPVLYIEGIRMTAAEARSGARCGQEHIAVLAGGLAAVRRCFEDARWSIEVWERFDAGWQAVAVQSTVAVR